MAATKSENDVENGRAAEEKPFDPVAFDAAMEKWRGFLREQMIQDGFATTTALMNDIRDRQTS